MVFNFTILGFVVVVIWLIALSIFYYRMFAHYNSLTKGITNKTLKSVLEDLLNEVQVGQKDIDYLRSFCDNLKKDGLLHIQRIGLLRFNPFKDTGGDQSFILALLDANETGVVVSGLYSRSGTRWYAKKVVSGKGVEHELSEEEKRAVKEAAKI